MKFHSNQNSWSICLKNRPPPLNTFQLQSVLLKTMTVIWKYYLIFIIIAPFNGSKMNFFKNTWFNFKSWLKKENIKYFLCFLMLKLCKTILSQFDCFSRRFKIKLSKWKFVQKYQSLLNFKINVLVPTNFILLVNLFWNFYIGLNSI